MIQNTGRSFIKTRNKKDPNKTMGYISGSDNCCKVEHESQLVPSRWRPQDSTRSNVSAGSSLPGLGLRGDPGTKSSKARQGIYAMHCTPSRFCRLRFANMPRFFHYSWHFRVSHKALPSFFIPRSPIHGPLQGSQKTVEPFDPVAFFFQLQPLEAIASP